MNFNHVLIFNYLALSLFHVLDSQRKVFNEMYMLVLAHSKELFIKVLYLITPKDSTKGTNINSNFKPFRNDLL